MLNEKVLEYRRTGNENVFEEILEEVSCIITCKANKYNIAGMDFVDKQSELNMVLTKAISTYSINIGASFKTYYNCLAENHLINIAKSSSTKNKEKTVYWSEDQCLNHYSSKNTMHDIEFQMDIKSSSLTLDEKMLLEKLIFENKTTTSVAKELGVTKGRISQKMKVIFAKLQAELYS